VPYFYYRWQAECGLFGQTCYYEIDAPILLLMGVCRLFLIWRSVFAHSRFWVKQALFQKHYTILDVGPSLFQRYHHRQNPIKLHLFTFSVYLFIWSFIHCIFERAAEDFADAATIATLQTQPVRYRNLIWMHIVTATTIGYGQYTTFTYPGRFFLVVTIAAGAYFIGLIVSAIGSAMLLDSEEEELYDKVTEHLIIREMEVDAAIAVQTVWRARKAADMNQMTGHKRAQYLEETYFGSIEKFKNTRKRWLNLCTKDMEVEPMAEKLVVEGNRSSNWEVSLITSLRYMTKRQKELEKRQVRVEKELMSVNKSTDKLMRSLEKISGCTIKTLGKTGNTE